jgi:hypothetical protein
MRTRSPVSECLVNVKIFGKSKVRIASPDARPTNQQLSCSKFIMCVPHTTQHENETAIFREVDHELKRTIANENEFILKEVQLSGKHFRYAEKDQAGKT